MTPAERKRRSRDLARTRAIDSAGDLTVTQICEALPFLVNQGGVAHVSELCRVLLARTKENVRVV